MGEDLERGILQEGAFVYSSGGMRRFSKWVDDFIGEGSDFVRFYYEKVEHINLRERRLFSIDSFTQENILKDYFSN